MSVGCWRLEGDLVGPPVPGIVAHLLQQVISSTWIFCWRHTKLIKLVEDSHVQYFEKPEASKQQTYLFLPPSSILFIPLPLSASFHRWEVFGKGSRSKMKLNYETALIGEKVILVPYRPEHVPRYHDWMKDPALLEATGSEPLSFEEEMEMQQAWRDDPKKCTFIVHSTEACPIGGDDDNSSSEMDDFSVRANLAGMVGDVNLFLSEIDDDDDGGEEENRNDKVDSNETPRIQAEVDIMIADKDYQKKGLGRAATCSMILYGAKKLDIQRFFCKINDDNVASINLFKRLGFVQCDYAECFKQVELELEIPWGELQILLGAHGNYREVRCPIEDDSY